MVLQQFDDSWSRFNSPSYKSYTLTNFRDIPQIKKLSREKQFEIEVVGNVLPFKTNNYVVEQLIDWKMVPNDPIFILNFPQRNMLKPKHYLKMATALEKGLERKKIQKIANEIRLQLNPHPAGQMEHNVPQLRDGTKLYGMQHKYKETVLFFPSQGQTCHAYCSFCFRWPQFVGMDELKFAMHEVELLVQYLREHPEVTDVLFTGGDPLIMKTKLLAKYIDSLLDAKLPNLRTIRIGTKALSYWPYRFISDQDADELLELFEKVVASGIHLAIMAHFNPGAQHYFGVPLVRAQEIFRDAYQMVSGLARTVRGPSMSSTPGKIQILGVTEIGKVKAI